MYRKCLLEDWVDVRDPPRDPPKMAGSCFHSNNRSTRTRSPISSRLRRIHHNRLIPRQLSNLRISSLLCAIFKRVFSVVRLITRSRSRANPNAHSSLSLSGVSVVAIDLPGIQNLFETSLVRYSRLLHVRVQARRASQRDLQHPLTTYVTDRHGRILIETKKYFNPQDTTTGIIFLRYPDPIDNSSTNPRSTPIYNEWYVPLPSWSKIYHGTPGEEYAFYESKKLVEKEGLVITPEVIRILGGQDGQAVVQPAWGGSMLALDGGLLVSDGSCIAPRILERYFKCEGPIVRKKLVRTQDRSSETKAQL
ncbi:hypothetical protein BGX38DRAFT_747633 [Terfezia claveryi]|nr:hypothetical protein BGX38DRAFT_747633 [Terfezia claveryi]